MPLWRLRLSLSRGIWEFQAHAAGSADASADAGDLARRDVPQLHSLYHRGWFRLSNKGFEVLSFSEAGIVVGWGGDFER